MKGFLKFAKELPKFAWRDLRTPEEGATPYRRGAIFAWHVLLGSGVRAALVWAFGPEIGSISAVPVAVAIKAGYWIIKERGDRGRGGAWKDGVEDSFAVFLGALCPAPPWWALTVNAAALVAYYRGWRAQVR